MSNILMTHLRLLSINGETQIDKQKPSIEMNCKKKKKKRKKLFQNKKLQTIKETRNIKDDNERNNKHDDEDPIYTEARLQLMEEMKFAGMENCVPLSFGSSTSHKYTHPRVKRQKKLQESNFTQIDEASQGVNNSEICSNEASVVDQKVHIRFDRSGVITSREMEPIMQVQTVLSSELQQSTCDATTLQQKISDGEVMQPEIRKFWEQRQVLFYKYDNGIQLDYESWYSVTPEAIAEAIANRCACNVIVDAFAGCGGNTIQFAKTCQHVIAIEIDPEKVRMAKENAKIYGVAHKIDWVIGDTLKILPLLANKVDVVFLSPPWGGNNYDRNHFGLKDIILEHNPGNITGMELFEIARKVSSNVAYYLPRTTVIEEVTNLVPVSEAVECQYIYLNGLQKVLQAYFGNLVKEIDYSEDTDPIS